jgi:hypothetical protein
MLTADNVPTGHGQGDIGVAPRSREATVVNNLPTVTTLFKGRQGILEKLDAYFYPRASGVYRRYEFLLYGMGGGGKSQIALKFAEHCEQRWVILLAPRSLTTAAAF